ncbi:MAG: hypothetical protein K5839_01655 [Treponemataceae bacterium]|nr:hypothetical protein [Treponemataceae bacterium]
MSNLVKKMTLALTGIFLSAAVFAYNPSYNSDGFFELTSPDLISGASSVSGGAIQNVGSYSIVLNPALIAGEQRYAFDAAYTAIFPTASGDSYAQAAQLGLVIPSRYGVGAILIQGIFSDKIASMDFGNSFTFRGAYAKDLTDRLYIGLGLYGGLTTELDYAVACDFGFWYMLNKISFLPFLSNVRWAVSGTAFGKSYETESNGYYYGYEKLSAYPSPFTLRVGMAFDVLNIKNFEWGFSTDASFPSFQNAVFDVGMQMLICEIVKISTSWEANVAELVNGVDFNTPTVGLSFNFNFQSSKETKWKENEGRVSSAYRFMPNNTQLVSAGFTAILGQEDVSAPDIILWEGEE